MGHFEDRCIERGIVTTDLQLLRAGIQWAIENGRADLVEEVKASHPSARYWRFRCRDGIFYAVTNEETGTWPATVLTQKMMRRQKRIGKLMSGGYKRGARRKFMAAKKV